MATTALIYSIYSQQEDDKNKAIVYSYIIARAINIISDVSLVTVKNNKVKEFYGKVDREVDKIAEHLYASAPRSIFKSLPIEKEQLTPEQRELWSKIFEEFVIDRKLLPEPRASSFQGNQLVTSNNQR